MRPGSPSRSLLLLVACGGLLQAACDGNERGAAEALPGKLRVCRLLGEGTVNAREHSELSECIARCRLEASCEELSERYCNQTATGMLLQCEASCFEPIDCRTTRDTYTLLERCDGKKQCADGSDELSCPGVQHPARYCESGGERIWTFQQCNGIRECEDGTDERGCPGMAELFVCKGRIPQRVLRSQVCDLVLDCLDGSDESAAQGCAQLCR